MRACVFEYIAAKSHSEFVMAFIQQLFFLLAGAIQKLMAAAEFFGLGAALDTFLAWLHILSRGFAGGFAAAGLESALRPSEPIVLYEYTG